MPEYQNCVGCGRCNTPALQDDHGDTVLACTFCGETVIVPPDTSEFDAWNRRQIQLRREIYREAVLRLAPALLAYDPVISEDMLALSASRAARAVTLALAPLSPVNGDARPQTQPDQAAAPLVGPQKKSYATRNNLSADALAAYGRLNDEQEYSFSELSKLAGYSQSWLANLFSKFTAAEMKFPVPIARSQAHSIGVIRYLTGRNAKRLLRMHIDGKLPRFKTPQE